MGGRGLVVDGGAVSVKDVMLLRGMMRKLPVVPPEVERARTLERGQTVKRVPVRVGLAGLVVWMRMLLRGVCQRLGARRWRIAQSCFSRRRSYCTCCARADRMKG